MIPRRACKKDSQQKPNREEVLPDALRHDMLALLPMNAKLVTKKSLSARFAKMLKGTTVAAREKGTGTHLKVMGVLAGLIVQIKKSRSIRRIMEDVT